MKKRNVFLLRIAAVILTLSCIYIFAPWQAAVQYLSPLPKTVQAQLDLATESRLDGIILYVDKGGQTPELYSSGWHDRVKKIPADPQALFKIASIGKLYKASAMAKLAASGRLSLEDTLAHHLPSLVGEIENADIITLRMMVQHRSGIPNYTDQPNFDWSKDSLDALDLVLGKPANFKPGEKYKYSNTNYYLLGLIMDRVLGYNHTQYIQDEILDPLGLQRTFFSVENVNMDEVMSGYHIGFDDDFKSLDQGYVASAQDVGIFLRALNDGSLFSEKERDIYSKLYEFGHTGWVLGNSSRAYYFKDMDRVVIQFVNTTGNDTVIYTEVIYNRIIKILRKRGV